MLDFHSTATLSMLLLKWVLRSFLLVFLSLFQSLRNFVSLPLFSSQLVYFILQLLHNSHFVVNTSLDMVKVVFSLSIELINISYSTKSSHLILDDDSLFFD